MSAKYFVPTIKNGLPTRIGYEIEMDIPSTFGNDGTGGNRPEPDSIIKETENKDSTFVRINGELYVKISSLGRLITDKVLLDDGK